LKEGGYIRKGFECYSLPDSPMTKAFNQRKTLKDAWNTEIDFKISF
jgi:hypothetical protein